MGLMDFGGFCGFDGFGYIFMDLMNCMDLAGFDGLDPCLAMRGTRCVVSM